MNLIICVQGDSKAEILELLKSEDFVHDNGWVPSESGAACLDYDFWEDTDFRGLGEYLDWAKERW